MGAPWFRWTDDERDKMREMASAGIDALDIASALDRTLGSVIAQASRMGIFLSIKRKAA